MSKTTQPTPSVAQKSLGAKQNLAAPSFVQAAVAVGQVGRWMATEACLLEACLVNLAVAGTAGQTDAQFRRLPRATGTPANIGSAFSILNTETDPITRVIPLNIEVEAGDIIELNVTAAPTAGTNLVWSPIASRQFSFNP